MKRQLTVLLLMLLMLLLSASGATAQEQTLQGTSASQTEIGTSITYQGRLNDNGQPANGAYDLQFQLYDALSDGTQVGNTVTQEDVPITDGMFNVQLDFGGNVFDGNRRYLAVAVRPGNSSGPYTVLNPRQEVTPVPYAYYANRAIGLSAPDGSPSDVIHIDPDGRVGIGTTTPNAELVVHDLSLDDDPFGGSALVVESSVGKSAVIGADNNYPWMGSLSNHDLRIVTNNVEKMRVTKDGSVGIGTTSPGFLDADNQRLRLDVVDRIRVRQGSTTAAGIWFYQNGPQTDRAFVGMASDSQVGFFGMTGAGWGFVMDTSNGDVNITGKTSTKVLQINGGADLAESFAVTGAESIDPGFVVSIDPDHPGQLRISDTAYDRTVAGIISGAGGVNPGMVMQQQGTIAEGAYPVSVIGRVYAWADATYGAIEPGDLLTTSDMPGHIMKVADYAKAQGAIIGKAMSSLHKGKGLILVLVSLQ